jgi:Na+/H+-dicarboxylate symporter
MQEDMTDVALSERVNRPRWRLSLSTSILLGMVAGIAAGIFFGEYMAPLAIVGNGFVKLLQMTILPYIFVSLIAGIGSLTFEEAKTLIVKAGLILLVYWVISCVFVLLMPLAFPDWESASFFSSVRVETPKSVDFLDLYISANPFKALSNNLVPAVVLLRISVGVALIGIRNKEPLLAQLGTLSEALVKVAGLGAKLTPLGVFAIAASAAGTMTVDEISKLQVYLITFTAASLILAFWVLPMPVAVATPFR